MHQLWSLPPPSATRWNARSGRARVANKRRCARSVLQAADGTSNTAIGTSLGIARHIASTDLMGYVDWPHHAQVFRYERTRIEHGTAHQAARYGIASLPPEVADAPELLALKRAY